MWIVTFIPIGGLVRMRRSTYHNKFIYGSAAIPSIIIFFVPYTLLSLNAEIRILLFSNTASSNLSF